MFAYLKKSFMIWGDKIMTDKKKILLIGAGGHSKVVLDAINCEIFEVVGFLQNDPSSIGSTVCNVPIIGQDKDMKMFREQGVTHAVIALGHLGKWQLRDKLYTTLLESGFEPATIIHSSAVVSKYAKLGRGTVILAGAIVNAGATIGENCIINTGAIIEHDVSIGNNVHIAPKAAIAGTSSIGDNSFIGIGSSVIQGIKIGKECVIGAGSVVLKNVEDYSMVYGVPAQVINKEKQ